MFSNSLVVLAGSFAEIVSGGDQPTMTYKGQGFITVSD